CRVMPRRSHVTAARRLPGSCSSTPTVEEVCSSAPSASAPASWTRASSSRTRGSAVRPLSGNGSAMGMPRSSATDPGAALVAALGERDFDRLVGMLAPDVRMRALIPPGLVELSGAELAAARFASWFGESNGLEVVRSGCDEVGDRLHVFYRLRVKMPGDPWKVIEQ